MDIININIISDFRINLKNNNNNNNNNNKYIIEILLFLVSRLYYKLSNKNEILKVKIKIILIFNRKFYKYYKTKLLNKN